MPCCWLHGAILSYIVYRPPAVTQLVLNLKLQTFQQCYAMSYFCPSMTRMDLTGLGLTSHMYMYNGQIIVLGVHIHNRVHIRKPGILSHLQKGQFPPAKQ